MSNSFTVDYAGISEASSLANSSKETLLDNLKEMNTKINELNCKDYFVGTIADDAMENWKKLNDGTEATINILANLSSYLDKTNENYANTDKLAADILATSTTTGITFTNTSSTSGNIITLPDGLGSVHTYMGWQKITNESSNQYKLREAAGQNFDSEGFAKIGDRYVVATTTTFGKVGDYIDIKQKDGTVIQAVIGDIKSQGDAGCNKWGHNNGNCVVEFVVDTNSWYKNGSGSHVNPGTSSCHPEWNQNIVSITNTGSYYDQVKV